VCILVKLHTNRLTFYIETILKNSLKTKNITKDLDFFLNACTFDAMTAVDKQLHNELAVHIKLSTLESSVITAVREAVRTVLSSKLKRSELLFLRKLKQILTDNFFYSDDPKTIESFLYELWSVWYLELYVDIYINCNNKRQTLNYTTHEIINKITHRYVSFCLFYDEDYILEEKEKRLLYAIILKLLKELTSRQHVQMKITYEYDKEFKSIHMYTFIVLVNIKFNVFYFKINLVKLSIFINSEAPYSKGLTYLNVNKIMLNNETNPEEFNLKDLSILDRLFSIEYVFDTYYYNKIYDKIYSATPKSYTDVDNTINFNIKNSNLGAYWYNVIYLNLKDDILWLEKGFYWNYMFDFRGRLYVDSVISYQSSKIFRHLYGYKIGWQLNKEKSIITNIEGHLDTIKLNTSFALDYPHIDFENNKKEIFWLFIEIAKIFKNNYLKTNKYELTTEELIQIGIFHYNCDENELDFEKLIEYEYIKSIFYRLNTKSTFNFIIFKDATASALQLLTLVLGIGDKALVEIFNLKSTTSWYDPYTYIIGLFLKQTIVEKRFLKYFCRKYLKKTIMTYNYSASLHTCMNNFYAEIEVKTFSTDEKKIITDYFVEFYKFLEKLFEGKKFFEKSLAELNESLLDLFSRENRLHIYLNDESRAALHYYHKKPTRINQKNDLGNRVTTLLWLNSEVLNLKKTTTSLRPNTIHALDAALVRLTIHNYSFGIATVHDSFGAPLWDIEGVICKINNNLNLIYYKTKEVDWYTNREYFSIYVVF
jgi:hypothetical protein